MASSCMPQTDVRLAPFTTFEVGGAARYLVEAADSSEVASALAWASEKALPVAVLGGGSNLLVADRGFEGLVIRQRDATIEHHLDGDQVQVRVAAGMNWDALVAWTVQHGFAGIECLSGIPGDVGAAPVQNIGAYGQDVSEVITRVEVIDRRNGESGSFDKSACCFDYRDSMFKSAAPNRYIITAVCLTLGRAGRPTVRYPELERALTECGEPSLLQLRETVIRLRRKKSMVVDSQDENRRSAGSFFVNPIVNEELARHAEERAAVLAPGESMPRYPTESGAVKLSAAWLIERAGMVRGTSRGPVGISSRHSLAIINRGGASAREIVDFACEVKGCVEAQFGIDLIPEPRPLGFRQEEIAPLYGDKSASRDVSGNLS